jgi:hypothetical protein
VEDEPLVVAKPPIEKSKLQLLLKKGYAPGLCLEKNNSAEP